MSRRSAGPPTACTRSAAASGRRICRRSTWPRPGWSPPCSGRVSASGPWTISRSPPRTRSSRPWTALWPPWRTCPRAVPVRCVPPRRTCWRT
ncbi:hypothetical protein ACFFX0_04410 [Citricoccus parietis]|uniref:Uncharacterized protein n=1 Tax=Citricoccus parietis TaxID=592307 RepID=A0ABV5FUW5_9MICC